MSNNVYMDMGFGSIIKSYSGCVILSGPRYECGWFFAAYIYIGGGSLAEGSSFFADMENFWFR